MILVFRNLDKLFLLHECKTRSTLLLFITRTKGHFHHFQFSSTYLSGKWQCCENGGGTEGRTMEYASNITTSVALRSVFEPLEHHPKEEARRRVCALLALPWLRCELDAGSRDRQFNLYRLTLTSIRRIGNEPQIFFRFIAIHNLISKPWYFQYGDW